MGWGEREGGGRGGDKTRQDKTRRDETREDTTGSDTHLVAELEGEVTTLIDSLRRRECGAVRV